MHPRRERVSGTQTTIYLWVPQALAQDQGAIKELLLSSKYPVLMLAPLWHVLGLWQREPPGISRKIGSGVFARWAVTPDSNGEVIEHKVTNIRCYVCTIELEC